MTKLIGLIIGHTINVIGIIVALPFVIIGGIFSGFSRARNAERNQQNGADIRALCAELGVPADAYNRVVIGQMHRAKDMALKIGQPGELHHASPWNTRLALAISAIYKQEAAGSDGQGLVTDEYIKEIILAAANGNESAVEYPNLTCSRVDKFADKYTHGAEWYSDYRGMRFWMNIDNSEYVIHVRTIEPGRKSNSGVSISAKVVGEAA